MAEVLDRIVARKRIEVAERLGGQPVAAEPTKRSLRRALARDGARFIMEVKKASPSGHRAAVTLDEAVAAYRPVADAISVLTDGPDFGGSLDDLRRVRQAFDGPVLAKDFIVDAAQVSEARAGGADAVLVMLSVLEDRSAAAVLAEARRLGMDAVVEVHDEGELSRALGLGASIVGVNNRDLKTLAVDLGVTARLAPLVPREVVLIAESGIMGRRDVERLAPSVDAFLVGSSLMSSPDVAQAARSLVYGRVKLCGLTSEKDVALAARAGATHAGLIFVPVTPRAIGPRQGRELAKLAQDAGLKAVGVFRDAGAEDVATLAEGLGLNAVQLHGREDAGAVRRMLPRELEVWAACPVNGSVPPERTGADRTLFDTERDGRSGGTGRPFDWALIAGRPDLGSSFLAGGIGPANVAAAARVGAFGLDVGSAVELAPGVKDAAQVKALFAALRPSSRRTA